MMATHDARALRLILQFLRAKESGDPYAFRFEPQDYILPTIGGDSASARFDWTPEVLAELQALRRPGRDPELVQRMGERLRAFIHDARWAQMEVQILRAIAEHRPIYLTIRSAAAELYALPWELLTLKTGQFIGEVDDLLIRFEWPESRSARRPQLPSPEGGRILIAWSAAAGAVPAAEHIGAIANACAAGFHPFQARNDVLADASLEQIVKTLEQAQQTGAPITVLHLLCHGSAAGSTFGLALTGADGPVIADAAQLRQQLAPFASMVRLVVLSACDSGNLGTLGNRLGSAAQALHRCGFHAVIASRFPLSVAGSIALTQSFYHELLHGPASLETSFLAARKRLLRSEANLQGPQRQLDWASLQLYARNDDGDDTRPVVFRPYRGLLAFQPEHRRFFFGREKEISEIVQDLHALRDQKLERLLIVAGASGTGKSSLVFAGAVPKLQQENPRLDFLRMRPGSDPNQALTEVLARRAAGAPALLVVDQFEEVFTQTQAPAAREAFVRRLWSLAGSPGSELSIIITLRVDFIGRCGELVVNDAGRRLDCIAYDEKHRIFVAQFQPEQLRAAIVEPARKVGLTLQAGLVDRMLYEVDNEPGALPMLEDALDVLWQHRDGSMLTQAVYEDLDGVIGALQRRADAVVEKLGKNELPIVQRMLVNLVAVAENTALDTRLRVPLTELQHAFTPAESAGFDLALREMVTARLLVQDGEEELAQVEVAHEALIRKWPKLRAWLDENRAGLLLQRRVKQAAQQWEVHQFDESLLYRGGQLLQASEWRKGWALQIGELEQRFLNASEAHQQQLKEKEAAQQRRQREVEARLAEEQRQKAQQKLEAAQALAKRTRLAAIVLGLLFVASAAIGAQAYRASIRAAQQSVIAAQNAALAEQKSKEAKQRTDEVLQKSEEAQNLLLVAVAQTLKSNSTEAATILREVKRRDSTLWSQAVSDTLQIGVAETVLRGHLDSVNAVAFSSDGRKIATGAEDGTARIWNADGTGEAVVLKGHEQAVYAVAFSPDGRMVVTGSRDGSARLWNADGSGPARIIAQHHEPVNAVAFSPDGKKIITGSDDQTLRIWSVDGSAAPIVQRGHIDSVSTVAFSPDGKRIFTGSDDKTVRIWNADGSGIPRTLSANMDRVTSVASSPDGKTLAVGLEDNTIRVWNLDGSAPPRRLDGHRSSVTSVVFSPDGKEIASGSEDRTVRIWRADGSSGAPLVLRGHNERISSIAFSPDGKKLVVGSLSHSARVWNVSGSGVPLELTRHESAISAVAFSPDGRWLATGTADNLVRIWNSDGTGVPVILKGHTEPVTAVAFSPDGRKLVSGSADKTARLWNTDGSGAATILSGHLESVTAVAFSHDGTMIATGSEDKLARIWDADKTDAPLARKAHDKGVTSVAFSADGKKLATGSSDPVVRVWNVDGSGEPIQLSGHELAINAVAFSPTGLTLITGSDDKTARIWKIDCTSAPRVLRDHDYQVTSVGFSPDGRKVVTGSRDRTARIWNVDGNQAPVVLSGHRHWVSSVAFSPDGHALATGSLDKTARIWVISGDAQLEALWSATSDCLPVARRQELIGESLMDARQRYASCRQEVARRRGWPMP